jgi:hypothetical protein
MTLTLKLASVSHSRRYGTRIRSHQENSSAASLHRPQRQKLRWPADPPAPTAQPATTRCSAGQPSRNHWAAAWKTAALASPLQREALDKRRFSVPPIGPSSITQDSRYESSLRRYYPDTLPACLKYSF